MNKLFFSLSLLIYSFTFAPNGLCESNYSSDDEEASSSSSSTSKNSSRPGSSLDYTPKSPEAPSSTYKVNTRGTAKVFNNLTGLSFDLYRGSKKKGRKSLVCSMKKILTPDDIKILTILSTPFPFLKTFVKYYEKNVNKPTEKKINLVEPIQVEIKDFLLNAPDPFSHVL